MLTRFTRLTQFPEARLYLHVLDIYEQPELADKAHNYIMSSDYRVESDGSGVL